MSVALTIISHVFGWIYFTAWSVSFYGQLYTNWKLKSVEGYKLDFQVLNMTGFAFYSYINIIGYFYQDTNPVNNYGLGTVRIQDLAFSLHALLIVCITGVQCLIYPKGQNKVSTIVWYLLALYWIFAILFYILFNVTKSIGITQEFNYVILLGIFKLSISFIKYIPPAYWNFKRKSTVGWSIQNIILDFTGGLFSIFQVLLDLGNGTTVIINPIKFALGNISMIFDMLFMVQHFLLFRDAVEKNIIIANPSLGTKYTSL